MKDIAKTSRVNTALQVIQHMNDGMTVVSACKEVGIPRSTFYDVVNKNPEAVTDYQEIVDTNYRHQLGLILFHKTEILQKVLRGMPTSLHAETTVIPSFICWMT